MQLEDVDLDEQTITVRGKRNRVRLIPYGYKTAQALDRYLRVRSKHRHARLPALWIARKGALTDDGIYQMVERRAREAGISATWVHRFRHTSAHVYLASGGEEGDL